MLLIGPGTVVTFGASNRVLPDSGVLIDGDVIRAVGPWKQVSAVEEKVEHLDADGRVILPGLVNAHMHFYSTFARGMSLGGDPASNFNDILKKLWWRLDKALGPEDCYLSAALPILQGIKYGVTTYIDHHASPFYRDGTPVGCLEEIGQAVIDTGVRACCCYEVSDRDGETIALAGMSENERFLEMCRAGHGAGRLSGMIGLHAQFTCGDETLEAARQLDEYEHAGVHIHCAEALSDAEDARARGFGGCVERLAAFDLLTEKTILAHCVHVSEKELEIIAKAGAAVVHQPTSNMNNAVGAANIVRMKELGILAGIGTDGMAPNPLDDFKAASWLARHRAGDPRSGWGEPYEMFVKGNSAIASRYFEKPVGVLEEGAFGDVAVMDYYPPTPLNDASCFGHVLFGLAYADAWATVCHGKVLLKEKKLTGTIDEEGLAERAREHAADLWERI